MIGKTAFVMSLKVLLMMIENIGTFGSSVTKPFPRVAVIGGGAAGYFSSIECAMRLKEKYGSSYEVVIFEAGRVPLSKVLISGGGRCNVMHDPRKGAKEISKGYPRGQRELLGPLTAKFGPDETFHWFYDRGVRLKVEPDGRVFPETDRAETIIDTLQREAQAGGVKVVSSAHVNSISVSSSSSRTAKYMATEPARFVVEYSSRSASTTAPDQASQPQPPDGVGSRSVKSLYPCDRVIFATGSSRKGYDILSGLGHSLSQPLPSLFSFKIQDDALAELAGLPLPSVETAYSISSYASSKISSFRITDSLLPQVRLVLSKEERSRVSSGRGGTQLLAQLQQRGPLMITHQGISGPAVLKLSAFGAKALAMLEYDANLQVNWLPDVHQEQLLAHFTAQRTRNPNKLVGTWFPPLHIEEPSLPEQSEGRLDWLDIDESSDTSSSGSGGDSTDADSISIHQPGQRGLPRRMWQYLMRKAEVDEKAAKWGTLSRMQMQRLADETTRQKLRVKGRGLYRDEFVTCGGVDLREVSFDSMESRVVPGLYLAGEVLDIDGVTGGYNFQAAWSGGWIAGHYCASSFDADTQR